MSGSGKQQIAVIGAGVAGITAALALSEAYDVTLFEKNDRLGGHTNTVVVEDAKAGHVGVDTGFIVLNDRTYPTVHRLFARLGVAVRYADMSFSVQCEQSGITYGSRSLASILCTPRNFMVPAFYRLLLDFPRFWRHADRWLKENPDSALTVAGFVRRFGYSRSFLNNFLLPMGAAIWSSPDQNITEFPIRFFLRFFRNHGMLSYADQPRWQTVDGGSHSYLTAFVDQFTGKIEYKAPVKAVSRSADGVQLQLHGSTRNFDHCVIASHADEALSILADADPLESELLATWEYQPNHAVLHTDVSFLPDNSRAHASWNYRRGKTDMINQPVSITYDMTRLQGLTTESRYLVTLNPHREIRSDAILYDIQYRHPQYTLATEAAQRRLGELRARNRTTFAGSYFGFGFHEDACAAGLAAAEALGGSL